jgi:hypothetical protein
MLGHLRALWALQVGREGLFVEDRGGEEREERRYLVGLYGGGWGRSTRGSEARDPVCGRGRSLGAHEGVGCERDDGEVIRYTTRRNKSAC